MKIVALALAGVLTLSLAACGDQDTPTASSEPASPPMTSSSSDGARAAGFTGTWLVQGTRLVVDDDHSAHSSSQALCPAGWGSASACTREVDYRWTEGDGLQLTVLDVWVTDGTRQQFPDPPPPMSAGSFFTMTLNGDGSATTVLHNDDGVVKGSNGLGNPYLCRAESQAMVHGVCES